MASLMEPPIKWGLRNKPTWACGVLDNRLHWWKEAYGYCPILQFVEIDLFCCIECVTKTG
jgi:hypothetical protein